MTIMAVNIGQAFKLGGESIETKQGYGNINSLVSVFLKNAYVIASVVLLFLLIGGGFTMISSAGNLEKQQQGSKALTSAIVGFLIIFTSYWIIQIIEVLTGLEIINPPDKYF